MKNKATAHLRIYVGSIPEGITIDNLYDHFKEFGQIDGIIISKHFGFVQFEQESSVQEAICKANGSLLNGKNIIVRTAQTQNDKRPETEVLTIKPDIPPAVALSDNLPVIPDEADLYDSHGNYIQDTRDEEYEDHHNWSESMDLGRVPTRGRGMRGGPRGRGMRGRMLPHPSERAPAHARGERLPDRDYDRYQKPEYPRAVPGADKNDCEIIVVSKSLTEYAEYIENRLKRLGIVVDLLYPLDDVPIGKVLGTIASRGALYAILLTPQNQEHKSLTLTILHGLPQEHCNMPVEDALRLLSRNFQEVQRGGPGGREAVYALLGQLADGRTLTVLQYDKVIEYLKERREQQVKIELGEMSSAPASKTQVDLQQRILNILNEKKVATSEPAPVPAPVTPAPAQPKLLNDPTVKKALDSILQKFI